MAWLVLNGKISLKNSPWYKQEGSVSINLLQIVVKENHKQSAWKLVKWVKTGYTSIIKKLHEFVKCLIWVNYYLTASQSKTCPLLIIEE